MNLKEFLESNPMIKGTVLASHMWPDKKHAAQVFSNKITEKIAGSGKQRITEGDELKAKEALKDLAKRIEDYTG